MDFQFNFQVEDSTVVENQKTTENCSVPKATCSCRSFSMQEALAKWKSKDECDVRKITIGDESYYILSTFSDEIDHHQESDRVPGVYEGGLKVWECSLDLACFISENRTELTGKIVCELGCGVGLPGMVAARRKCAKLMYQDYNDYVLTNWTAPSVCCNYAMTRRETQKRVISKTEVEEASRKLTNFLFVSGDWSDCTFPEKADVVLTAETIYETSSYAKLHDLLDRSLCATGFAYVASKAYYFGVGGGTHEWMRFCERLGVFDAEIAHCVDAPLKRFILKITRKS